MPPAPTVLIRGARAASRSEVSQAAPAGSERGAGTLLCIISSPPLIERKHRYLIHCFLAINLQTLTLPRPTNPYCSGAGRSDPYHWIEHQQICILVRLGLLQAPGRRIFPKHCPDLDRPRSTSIDLDRPQSTSVDLSRPRLNPLKNHPKLRI